MLKLKTLENLEGDELGTPQAPNVGEEYPVRKKRRRSRALDDKAANGLAVKAKDDNAGEEEDEDYCEAPCKHHPISNKYPLPLNRPHTNNLQKFVRDISKALKISYPRTRENTVIYDRAHILFLQWEDDDLGTEVEIDELQQLMQNLRFTNDSATLTTERYDIPSDNPQDSLELILVSRRNKFALEPGNLLVIYYGGHGEMNKERKCIWYPSLDIPDGRYERPELDWTYLQAHFQRGEGDVVFILDCCYAASMVRGSHSAWKGVKELLVASGKHERTDGVNDNSFTKSIIRELKQLKGKCTSISGLHASLVEKQELHGLRNTPIRIGLSERANQVESLHLVYPESSNQDGPWENVDSTTLDNGTRVLISIRLRNPANPVQVRDWLPWLQKQAPHDVLDMELTWTNYVRLEAVFNHGSTLLLLSLPLTVWNILPPDPSYSVIDVIKSGNLIGTQAKKPNIKAISTDVSPDRSHGTLFGGDSENEGEDMNILHAPSRTLFSRRPEISPPPRDLASQPYSLSPFRHPPGYLDMMHEMLAIGRSSISSNIATRPIADQSHYDGTDTTGQVAPPNSKPIVTTTKSEYGSLCFQVEVKGTLVARRTDDDMINGTKLLNVSGMTRGKRDTTLKNEIVRDVVKTGPMNLRGVWIPMERALDLANTSKITELLYPLFVDDVKILDRYINKDPASPTAAIAGRETEKP